MSYRWVEHTGELELEIVGAAEQEVFANALAALRDLLDGAPDESDPLDGARGHSGTLERAARGPLRRVLRLEAPDRGRLLACWLAELAFLAETEGFVPDGVERMELLTGGLHARVRGHAGEPPHLVKGVTYHRLAFAPADGGWRATVVLDV